MTDKTRDQGVGFAGLLALLFIGLKLAGKIGWSWWWVLSPIWITAALAGAVALIVLIGVIVYVWWEDRHR